MPLRTACRIVIVSAVLQLPAPAALADDAVPLGEPDLLLVHGAHDWINKGRYRSVAGELCCGKDDCYEVAPDRVLQNPQGYSLPDHNLDVPGRHAIPSEDGKYWVCKVGTRMRCFFAPLNGF